MQNKERAELSNIPINRGINTLTIILPLMPKNLSFKLVNTACFIAIL